MNFVVGNRGSVVESDFYTKLNKLDVQEGKKDKLFADHVIQVCEAHNRVIVSVERWWTQDGKLGITIQDPPPESGRRTHLLDFTYFVLHSVTCLKTCLFTACFTSL